MISRSSRAVRACHHSAEQGSGGRSAALASCAISIWSTVMEVPSLNHENRLQDGVAYVAVSIRHATRRWTIAQNAAVCSQHSFPARCHRQEDEDGSGGGT